MELIRPLRLLYVLDRMVQRTPWDNGNLRADDIGE